MQHEHAGEQAQTGETLDLNDILRAFGIEEWTNLGPPPLAAPERFSLLVEVGGQRYLLQERAEGPLGAGEQETEHRYTFARHLLQHGIPVVPLWPTPEGQMYVRAGEEVFELQAWPQGAMFETAHAHSSAWVADAGQMLARLHQASRRYRGPMYRWPSEVHAGGLTQGWLNFARERAEQAAVYAIGAALDNLVESWEAALPAAMMAIGAGGALPEFHIHGDYSPINLRFGGHSSEGVSAVLGLEASRWEKRLLELAYGVFSFGALAWEPERRLVVPAVKRGFEPERTRLFLQAYGSIYPPAPREASLLVDALTLVTPILVANGPLEDIFYEVGEMEEDTLVEDVLARIAWAASLPAWLNRVRRMLAEMWEGGK